MKGISLKIDGNSALTSGGTRITITVDKAVRAHMTTAQENVNLKRSGICRSIW